MADRTGACLPVPDPETGPDPESGNGRFPPGTPLAPRYHGSTLAPPTDWTLEC